jgi:hypothetical protein
MSDDMGYSDIGAMGGEVRTPAIDRLASRGRVFTQFYNTSRCCPTRASLLTGLYPHQAGIGHMAFKTPHRGYGEFLSPDSITIAEVLRDAGYRTYMPGKWHLAPRGHDPRTDLEHWPTRRGFEKFYGTIAGYGSFWDPATLCRGETFITPENDPEYHVHEGGISTPLIVQWPDRIPPDPSHRLVREPAHLIDIMATCLDAAGVQPPTERKGVKLQPLEGVSLMPVLTGSGALGRREPLFWEHEGNRAVREEEWKLVSLEGDPGWELYDMRIDRGEMNDVAAAFPHVVARLAAKWSAWAERSRIFPLGGWMDRVDETTLHLKQGDTLAAAASPVLARCGVTAVVKVLDGPVNGVLLAQGSRDNGYAVYIQNDTLSLVMRRNGELHRAEMRDVPPAHFTVFARISANGSATLGIDDRRIYTGFGGGFSSNPVEGLRVGFDVEEPIGEYPKEFRFRGKLGFVTLRGTVNKGAASPAVTATPIP